MKVSGESILIFQETFTTFASKMELESTTEIEMGTSIDIDGPDFVTIDLGDGLDGIEAIPERGDESPPNQECQGQFADFVGKSSMGKSIFKVSNAIMGSGVLGLAYGMDSTGTILFLILLTFMAILSAYLIHLLLRSAGIVEDLKWEANTTAMIKKAQKALLFKDSKKMKPVCRAA